ncbi:MAG: hypothetical protein NZ765_10755, partial [Anaerolineae bacterium]|nr:hypothetical protein [Anaerolineae bacterium]
LQTLSLPVTKLPEEYFRRDAEQLEAIGYGIPDPPVGIRASDRAPVGNNLEHDIMLLRTLYEFAEITGEARYARHADACLRFWLLRCQSPATGLMYSGEHASWDFLHERGYANTYEVYRRFPFWEKLYAIDPWRALRFADALWMAQIGNKHIGDYSRHALISYYGASTGAAYPRHAGFYIWAYAHAYAQTRDPKYIERAETLIESRTSLQPQPFSLLIRPGSWRSERSADPTLRALLWEAAALVPSRTETWRAIVRQLDERAFQDRTTESLSASSNPGPATQTSLGQVSNSRARLLVTQGGRRTESATLSPLWKMGYGSSGFSGRALLDYTRYLQTGDARFLRAVLAAADRYLTEGLPEDRSDLWPRAAGQVISLMVVLSQQPAVPREKRSRYLEFARRTADMALEVFPVNGLFRADGSARHYEAITGADDLVYALLQLYCALSHPPRTLPHIDVNW